MSVDGFPNAPFYSGQLPRLRPNSLAALVWPDRQHRDSDSRPPDPESPRWRHDGEHIHLHDFNLLWHLDVGGHFTTMLEARRRKSRPLRVCRNLLRVRCSLEFQVRRRRSSHATRAKRALRAVSYCSSALAETACMNLCLRKLTFYAAAATIVPSTLPTTVGLALGTGVSSTFTISSSRPGSS